MVCATKPDLCHVYVPIFVHSDQTSPLIGIATFFFLCTSRLFWIATFSFFGWFYFHCFLSFVIAQFWVIQCIGDLFGAFVNGSSIVGNASLFLCVKGTKIMCCATIVDQCIELLPKSVHSNQSSHLIGVTTFSFLCNWWFCHFQRSILGGTISFNQVFFLS